MKRQLKLKHHKHTGKLIHHRHTSYGALSILVAVTAFLSFITGQIANANDLLISATVPAPIPAGKPVFTAPQAGTITDTSSVSFEGTCPVIDPAIIVALYDQAELIGSGACSSAGTFQVTATVAPGVRDITARVITITNDTGESSDPLRITYTPKPTPPNAPTGSPDDGPVSPRLNTPGTTTPKPADAPQLQIIADKPFLSFGVNNPVRWSGSFRGGNAPYRVIINWGDGTETLRSAIGSEPLHIIHTYREHQIYLFSITISDASGLSLARTYVSMPVGTPQPAEAPIIGGFSRSYLDPTLLILAIYAALGALILLLWRYEHLHYRNLVGFPVHYGWQSGAKNRQRK